MGNLLEGRREDFSSPPSFTNRGRRNSNRLVTGSNRKAMVASAQASLKWLKTDRIDLCWMHHPDALTPSEEIVRGLEDLARGACAGRSCAWHRREAARHARPGGGCLGGPARRPAIIGPRTLKQLTSNLGAATLDLSADQLSRRGQTRCGHGSRRLSVISETHPLAVPVA